MKRLILLFAAFVILSGHDLYLKMDTYFLPPNTEAVLQLYNGTFHESDNVIDRDRMIDVSVVGSGQHLHPDTTQWTEQNDKTLLSIRTGQPGTYVAGVSTRARIIDLDAADFNNYLEHDGVLDMLEWRKANGAMDQDATEKYAKHVKAIFQVGDQQTADWQTRLGYPIEFVPLANPYHLHEGDDLPVQLLWQGEPLPNQLVYANSVAGTHPHEHTHADGTTHTHDHADGSHSHDHDEGDSHQHNHDQPLRTNAEGIITLQAPGDGIWYLRTIRLVRSDAPELTHESEWATLTFEIGSRHSHGETTHTHGEGEEQGIPTYAFVLVSIALIGGLYLWFNRKNRV